MLSILSIRYVNILPYLSKNSESSFLNMKERSLRIRLRHVREKLPLTTL
jgi:hypothetical protein